MSSEKTEEPTAKKLRDARDKGQIAKSQDVTTAVLMCTLFAVIAVLWDWLLQQLREMILLPAAFYGVPFERALPAVATGLVLKGLVVCLPFLGAAFVAGVAGAYFQVGPLLSFESIKPDLQKLDPMQKAKEIFSAKSIIELLKSFAKVCIISYFVYAVVRDSVDGLSRMPYGDAGALLAGIAAVMRNLTIKVGLAYVGIAAFDYAFQKYQHIKELRMSKDEVKREYKESEGDPHIKGKRKQLHQEMLADQQVQRTRKATVVVTNPTHFAVAIYYDEADNLLPRVIAKGADHVARSMVAAAKEEGIPVMQNVMLARALHADVPLDHFIPSDLIEPMAEVLRWVKDLRGPPPG